MDWSIFDIIGPIMIGPSSSHTAGAARLGYCTYQLFGKKIKEVQIILYGSFAQVYKGHGTDWALLGGLLGMNTDDENLSKAFIIAQDKGIKYNFIYDTQTEVDHPNTVKFIIKNINDDVHSVTGCSIGGGSIELKEIDGVKVSGLDGRAGKLIIIGSNDKDIQSFNNLVKSGSIFKNEKHEFVATVECKETDVKKITDEFLNGISKVSYSYFPKMNE